MPRSPFTLKTPKAQLIAILTLFLLVAVPFEGGLALLPKLAAAVLPACAIDVAWTGVDQRRWRWPSSALLTALIVFSILATTESWLVIAWTSSFGVMSKRILRTERGHIFNPAALALLWASIAFGSGESWWGALADQPWLFVGLLVAAGAYLTDQLNKLPMVLTFLGAYFGGFTLVALLNPHATAEMFRDPFLQAALFLAFFMLTDPPTSPNRYGEQVWYALVAAFGAVAAQLLGAGQVFLLVGVLLANATLAVVRFARRRGPAPRPEAFLVFDQPAR